MIELRQRLVLWTGVFALTGLLFIPKGHETPPGGAPSVAFLHGKPGTTTVRIDGNVPHPGIYRMAASVMVEDLIRQSAPKVAQICAGNQLLATPLADGDMVTVTADRKSGVTLARGSMPVRERMTLGIPLVPERMTAADWEALPGIGPALTERIISFSRRRGGIRTLEELRGVDGIGDRTIERLRPLFTYRTGNP